MMAGISGDAEKIDSTSIQWVFFDDIFIKLVIGILDLNMNLNGY